jgi:simple sugar transport system substrate-binding protein
MMRTKGLAFAVFTLVLSLWTAVVAEKVNAQENKKLVFYYVDHGPGQAFWPAYYKGIADATAMLAPLGVEVKHLSAGEQDMETQARLLKTAVAANPDGLVTTMRDPKTYDSILKPLVDKGVPIMAANIDDPRPAGQRIPYLAYYGENLRRSGVDLAEAVIAYVTKTGGKKPTFALLVSPVVGSRSFDERFRTFGERLALEYGTKSEQITDLDGEKVGAYLAKNPNVDVICAHEGWTWYRYLGVLEGMGKRPGKDVYVACFDVSSGLVTYIKNGEVVAASDEQQYLQGYLPLFDLYLYLTRGKVHPVSVFTGILIDQSNADSVREGALGGYR